MPGLKERIELLKTAGEWFRSFAGNGGIDNFGDDPVNREFTRLAEKAYAENPWFTPENIMHSFEAWGEALTPEKIRQWAGNYKLPQKENNKYKKLGLVTAGNIPMVGMHDLLCILLTGTRSVVKLSSNDKVLLPGIFKLMEEEMPEVQGQVTFTEGRLEGFDAVIATGSDNTARYFDYYFGKYPNIIRKNRNGVAVLTGQESKEELKGLAADMLRYFGLGCRNVSKLFVPAGYDFTELLSITESFPGLSDHNKYRNNYDYQKSILLINKTEHLDSGNLLLTKNKSISSPISVVYFEEYTSLGNVSETLQNSGDKIQCIVSGEKEIRGAIPFGKTQKPELWDYADNADVVSFLLEGKLTVNKTNG